MNIRQAMKDDAAGVAALIAADLGIQPGRTAFSDVCYLCERHGDKPLIEPQLCGVNGFCFGDGLIIVGGQMTHQEASTVLIHELAHRLCFSERYEHLNGEFAPKHYPKMLFWEYIARAVEQEFIKAGGYAYSHKRSLETYPLI